MGYEADDIVVITHIDDIAMSHAANVASFECLDFGIAKCGAVISVSGWLMEAANICRENKKYDIGVHLTLTSEYDAYRWRPLSTTNFDSGLLDAEGYLWYQGREDDMLKVSGQWVSPLEIEGILQEHPAVREGRVIGAPDESGLMKVKAFVVLDEGYRASPELETELTTFVHDRIAHFKTPRWVHFVQELPRTVTGKLQRHELRYNYP